MSATLAELDAGFRMYNFLVEIDGIANVGFSEVVMPEGWVDVIEYREAGEGASVAHKLAGRVHYGNLVLRRGVDENIELYAWWDDTRRGRVNRRSLSIVLLDTTGTELRRWNFSAAFPVRYGYSDLNAQGHGVLTETLELAYEDVSLG